MLLHTTLLLHTALIALGSRCVSSRKSEPVLDEAAAGLFRGADKYDFAVEVPAAGAECFWHFAHQSGNFYLTYLVSFLPPQRVGVFFVSRACWEVIAQQGFLVSVCRLSFRLITPTFKVVQFISFIIL